MKIKNWISAAVITSAIFSPHLGKAQSQEQNWYDNLVFENSEFTFQFIRALGYSYSGGADVGECIRTARTITNGDTLNWYQHWLNLAQRIHNYAIELEKDKDGISAKELYFRASNYYRTACFFLDNVADRKTSNEVWLLSKECFLKAISYLREIQPVKIPYEATTLPGYFIQSSQPNAPLIIVQTGFDGTKEEIYFSVGKAAQARGYSVLLFEGPGQGEVIRQQDLAFRYDWEKVITPIVDYAQNLPGINKNKIALIGISLGGYLVARAEAFEHRLAACVLNGGVFDLSQNLYRTMPEKLIALVESNPDQFNQKINENAKSVRAQWFFDNAMWTMHQATPADVMKEVKKYTLKGVIEKISTPTLVIDSESDVFFKEQPEEVFEKLKAPKSFLKFTKLEAAEAHCQKGAIAISNELIFRWLNKTLDWVPPIPKD